jgi:hypothetical protein
MKKIIQHFIKATNAFDVETTPKLFAHNAVIDDVSVGKKFKNTIVVNVKPLNIAHLLG